MANNDIRNMFPATAKRKRDDDAPDDDVSELAQLLVARFEKLVSTK